MIKLKAELFDFFFFMNVVQIIIEFYFKKSFKDLDYLNKAIKDFFAMNYLLKVNN